MAGKFAPGVFNDLLKREARMGKRALKRARTQAKFFRDIFERRLLPGHGSAESLLHLFANICSRLPNLQFRFQMRADSLQHFFVMGHEWCVQILTPKNESIALRFEMHSATEMAFQERAMLRRAS